MGKCKELFEEAKKYIPGGVNSPVRAFKGLGPHPIYFKSGKGPYLYGVEGKEFIDYVGSWGPLILGYSHPDIVKAIQEEAERATTFGAPTEMETEMARLITEMVPSVEMVRMVNSGTEATMSAIRLARAYTEREKIIKFVGCYHGHGDSFLIQAGSGAATLGVPSSPGVPKDLAKLTLVCEYNDLDQVKKLFQEHPGEIAAIIVEPLPGNMGVILPEEGFLQGLREVTKENGALLIFDEVMSGFRLAAGGAQEYYGIDPDLTTLGKIIGGGLPVGAYGGKKEFMEKMAPAGPVYQAGTLSGNPLAMRAGIETLKKLREPGFYENLEKISDRLEKGFRENFQKLSVPMSFCRVGSMGCLYFLAHLPKNYKEATGADREKFNTYYSTMIEEGVYFAPSPFEAFFISSAHGEKEIDKTIEANYKALEKAWK